MRKIVIKYRKIFFLTVLTLAVTGCKGIVKTEESPSLSLAEETAGKETLPQTLPQTLSVTESEHKEPVVEDMDWSGYFKGLNGAAVFYNPAENHYMVYNQELAEARRSPCSTFKIISSLIGLEEGVIQSGDSVRPWSGETFWNKDWNRDIGFEEAFRTSCIWYFREVIDELGPETVQRELERLQYGNCDISDWEGRSNTNNNNRALTGFWVEASLKISAMEQAKVMSRIFGSDTFYSEAAVDQLKQAMLLSSQSGQDETAVSASNPIYGKTGMGKSGGVVVDCWFTGFTETQDGDIFFCVYLGQNEGKDISSKDAKEIALEICKIVCYKIGK